MSLAHKGHQSYWKGKNLSEETKLKMSKNHADINGSKHPYWRGGKRINDNGYILIYSPKHPNTREIKCILEHRLVMEEFLNRYLLPEEVVHHINGIPNDNRIENLMLFANNGEHRKYHKKLKVNNYDKRRNYYKS